MANGDDRLRPQYPRGGVWARARRRLSAGQFSTRLRGRDGRRLCRRDRGGQPGDCQGPCRPSIRVAARGGGSGRGGSRSGPAGRDHPAAPRPVTSRRRETRGRRPGGRHRVHRQSGGGPETLRGGGSRGPRDLGRDGEHQSGRAFARGDRRTRRGDRGAARGECHRVGRAGVHQAERRVFCRRFGCPGMRRGPAGPVCRRGRAGVTRAIRPRSSRRRGREAAGVRGADRYRRHCRAGPL